MTIPYFPRIIRGAEAAAREREYSLIAVNSDDSHMRQKELLSLLRSQRVEGILLAVSAGPTPLAQISRIMSAGIRLVCVDRIPDRLPVDSVSVEDVSAAELGIDHLIAMGHQRIAIVTGPLTLKNERQRLLGYYQSLERAGIRPDPDLVWEGNILTDDVTAMCRDRLRDPGHRPDAVFATNGPTGLGVLRALHESGLRTPEDMALVTFDELTVDDLFQPAVTTVVQPAYDIGYRAAEILLKRIIGGEDLADAVTIRLPATLKVRDSSRLAFRAVAE
jgi:DNA-binding LacI/PurR family transcriptional regulator